MDQDIYTRVTNSIVEALERGTPPWVKPWSAAADPQPINATTRRPYRGVNFLTLQLRATACGYARNVWLTYRQASELGAQVRKGEHGVPIVFWQLRKVDARVEAMPWPDEVEVHEKVVPLLRTYTVFNVQQVDGLPAHLLPAPAPVGWLSEATAEDVLIRAQVEIRYGGDRAFYRPDLDYVQLPERGAFDSSAAFYATALHELVHASGNPKRLHRDLSGRFGDQSYAMEELVAELGAAFLCASCRIDGQLQHDSYVASWLKVLKNDKRAIFVASTKAQNAADFLLPHVDPLTADAVKEAA
jgi:antirestriction protein ArdC